MRISNAQRAQIVDAIRKLVGAGASVRLFGSRVNDAGRGGDVDLLVESPDPIDRPALLAARVAARVERVFDGRKVDVVLIAPNLSVQPIHQIARDSGVLL